MIREGNPRDRIRRAVCPWISVLARWNPLFLPIQWPDMMAMLIRGASPVDSTAPNMPMPRGKIKT